jgi:hypothetical protein
MDVTLNLPSSEASRRISEQKQAKDDNCVSAVLAYNHPALFFRPVNFRSIGNFFKKFRRMESVGLWQSNTDRSVIDPGNGVSGRDQNFVIW